MEVKTETPSCLFLGAGSLSATPRSDCEKDTMSALAGEKMVPIYLESDPNTDRIVVLADGNVTRIAATPCLNGIKWPIPANQKTMVPVSIYELVKNSIYQDQMLDPSQQREAEQTAEIIHLGRVKL